MLDTTVSTALAGFLPADAPAPDFSLRSTQDESMGPAPDHAVMPAAGHAAAARSRSRHPYEGRPAILPGMAGRLHPRRAGNQQHWDGTALEHFGCEPALGKVAERAQAMRRHRDNIDD